MNDMTVMPYSRIPSLAALRFGLPKSIFTNFGCTNAAVSVLFTIYIAAR